MVLSLCTLIVVSIPLLLLLFFYRTLYLYFTYKLRYGRKVVVLFYPLTGIKYFRNKSFLSSGDPWNFIREIIRAQPDVQAVLILSGIQDQLLIISAEWVRVFCLNMVQFEKAGLGFASQFLFSKGLFATENADWKRQRAFLSSSFHYSSLLDSVKIMTGCCAEFAEGLPKGEFEDFPTDVFKHSVNYTSEVVAFKFFGKSMKNIIMKSGLPFMAELAKVGGQTINYHRQSTFFFFKHILLGTTKATVTFNTKFELDLIEKIMKLREVVEGLIEERSKVLYALTSSQLQSLKNDFILDMLLRHNILQESSSSITQPSSIISKEEIIQQFFTFVFLGVETTVNLISMSLYMFSQHKEAFEQVKKEYKAKNIQINTIVPADLQKLTYTNCFLKEVLRYYPQIFTTILRKGKSYDFEKEGLFIAKNLFVSASLVQYDATKKRFRDIDTFDPTRWLNTDESEADPYEFIPFSAGPRNCIGQHMALIEVKVFLAYIIENFEVKKREDYKLKLIIGTTSVPIDKKMVLLSRKKKKESI